MLILFKRRCRDNQLLENSFLGTTIVLQLISLRLVSADKLSELIVYTEKKCDAFFENRTIKPVPVTIFLKRSNGHFVNIDKRQGINENFGNILVVYLQRKELQKMH